MRKQSYALVLIVALLIVLGAIAMHGHGAGWLSSLAAIHGHR
jgi:hypothetical protein